MLSQNDSVLDIFKNKQLKGMYGEKPEEEDVIATERGHSTLEKPLNDMLSRHNYRS